MKINIRVLGAFAAGSLAVGGATFAVAQSPDAPDTRPPATLPPDTSAGAAPRSLQARADRTPFGVPMAVLVYRNKQGAKCFAMGAPDGQRIVGARAPGSEVPLDLAGHCGAFADPLSYQLDQTPDGVVIYGLAADDVTEVQMTVGDDVVTTKPTTDGAFIASIVKPKLTGQPILRASKADGSTEMLRAAPLIDIAARNRALEEARRSGALQRLFDEAASR